MSQPRRTSQLGPDRFASDHRGTRRARRLSTDCTLHSLAQLQQEKSELYLQASADNESNLTICY